MTNSSFGNIIGLNHLNDAAWKQATLKIKLRGFTLTQMNQISSAAFLSSWCQSMKDLPDRFTSLPVTDMVGYLPMINGLHGDVNRSYFAIVA